MKPPPQASATPAQVVVGFLLAVVSLAVGLFSEYGTIPHPLVPIGDAVGMAIVAVGLGCAAGVAQRFYPRWIRLILYVLAVLMVLWQGRAMTSALPLAAMMFMYFTVSSILKLPDVKFSE